MIKYPVSKPYLNGNERKYLNEALDTEWLSWKGKYVIELEEAWAKYCGTKYAVATTSGTTALTLALAALNLRPGDEVIVPEFTMISSAMAVAYHSATPVFVDCGSDLNIDCAKIAQKITPRTKAIMPVHIYGRMCDMEKIMDLAFKYNLFVIEDACEAHGAWQHKREDNIGRNVKAGAWGDMGCFSLFANKIITSGEGGLVTTNDERLYRQLKHLNRMAFDEGHSFIHPKKAYNFVMNNLTAAVGLAQVETIDDKLLKRKQIAEWYNVYLKDWTISRPEGSVIWMYDIILPPDCPGDNLSFIAELEKRGIEARRFFQAMGLQPPFGGKWYDLKAHEYSRRGLYLPTYPQLTQNDVKYIAETVINIYKSLLKP